MAFFRDSGVIKGNGYIYHIETGVTEYIDKQEKVEVRLENPASVKVKYGQIKDKHRSGVLNMAFNIFSWAVIGFLGLCAISSIIQKDGQYNIFGNYAVCILSGSMESEIKKGALIINSSRPSANDINIGDIITYKVKDRSGKIFLITHRVIDVDRDAAQFRTQGDNLDRKDGYIVNYSDIVGKYRGVTVPMLGFVIAFYSSLYGIITLSLYLTAYIVLSCILKPKQQDNGKHDKIRAEPI